MDTWNLDSLYKGFSDENFGRDREKLFALAEDHINCFNEKKTSFDDVTFLEAALKRQEEMSLLFSRLFGFISLSRSADTRDKEANAAFVSVQPLTAKFSLMDSLFKQYLKGIENLDDVINKSKYLSDYRFIINESKEEINHTMAPELEVLASEMTQNGASLWSQLQRHLTSLAETDFRGEIKSLNEIRNLAYSSDKEIRKEAYHKELEIYKSIEEPMSFVISGVKGEVNILYKKRGYSSPLEEALFKSRMDKDTLHVLLGAMIEALPHFHKYLKHKARLLGHDKGLPWYDLFAPVGSSEKKYSVKDAQEFILEQFATFGPELWNMAARAFEDGWVDYFPRKGKVGGAFCSNNRAIKESRILINFGGEISDVITLAHELGHAYHGEQIFKESVLNSHYSMPVAESASTLAETIVKRAASKKARTRNEKIYLLEQGLQDDTQIIVDIYSRYVFEQSVFAARQKTIPASRDLNELMAEAQRKAYGDGLDPDILNPGMWINKSHYYSSHLSFYNFPYAFGLLFSKGLYANFVKHGPEYAGKIDTLLRVTGRMKVEDVAASVGINIKEQAFWESGLKTIIDDINEFIALTS